MPSAVFRARCAVCAQRTPDKLCPSLCGGCPHDEVRELKATAGWPGSLLSGHAQAAHASQAREPPRWVGHVLTWPTADAEPLLAVVMATRARSCSTSRGRAGRHGAEQGGQKSALDAAEGTRSGHAAPAGGHPVNSQAGEEHTGLVRASPSANLLPPCHSWTCLGCCGRPRHDVTSAARAEATPPGME